ncbi:THAP domain-containing protein [Ooceraea biroi]|uniref:THAP domain-containing protein n=1 Tax=Ooceraea biroi TaxID=2015173 RepID=A0A026X0G6_OOCBI|nr:THAP domain-containing protein [Ooceraea biroi]
MHLKMHLKVLPFHKMLHVLAWLEGTWITDEPGNGTFPHSKAFTYYDQINITSIGQPMYNYIAQSWHPESGVPMHRETGFLQILPTSNTVILSLIDNIGLFTVEEGALSDDNKSFDIRSSNVLATSASPAPFSSMTQVRSIITENNLFN